MNKTDTIIIGAGQAGLALSRCLTDRGVEHVLLERGRVAQRWMDRWESLRLLSPNWMTRLPGWQYRGPDPDGFMTRDEVVKFLTSYAASFGAPVQENTNVLYAGPWLEGWRVITEGQIWLCRNLVIATGNCDVASLPPAVRDLPPEISSIASTRYRGPGEVPEGGVLVVGASATGVQLAHELRLAGRQVTLAVGRHTRLPRRYRGRDIFYWLDRIGSFQRPLSDMQNENEARCEPSLQLAASDDGRSLDLATLVDSGVKLTGRLLSIEDGRAIFAGDLARSTADADEQLRKILARIDRHIASHALDSSLPPAADIVAVPVGSDVAEIDLAGAGIRSVVWATGYTRSYPWLHAPVLDGAGQIIHTRGRTPAPGLYVLGLQFLIRRNSSFIDGVGQDAEEIARHIAVRHGAFDRRAA